MTLYKMMIEIAQNEVGTISIDLCSKTIRVNGTVLLEHGLITRQTVNVYGNTYTFDGLLDEVLDLDSLYADYKFSLPSARDGRSYFKALTADELTDEQMVIGMNRLEARVRLEAYILLASLCGILTWTHGNHWYTKGTDPDFILLKKYFD